MIALGFKIILQLKRLSVIESHEFKENIISRGGRKHVESSKAGKETLVLGRLNHQGVT